MPQGIGFCIRLKPGEGWETEIVIKRRFGINVPILIDYNNLPIRHRFCLSTEHQIKNCDQLKEGKTKSRGRKPDQASKLKEGETRTEASGNKQSSNCHKRTKKSRRRSSSGRGHEYRGHKNITERQARNDNKTYVGPFKMERARQRLRGG